MTSNSYFDLKFIYTTYWLFKLKQHYDLYKYEDFLGWQHLFLFYFYLWSFSFRTNTLMILKFLCFFLF